MPSIKLTKFLGEAPKLSSELLPETVAQIASGVKLYSGDLIPYYKPSISSTLGKSGVIKTIYPLDDGAGGFKWLHWTKDVDVAKAQISNDTTQRTYYTGDITPRVTNYTLATSGGPTTYPNAYYTLGLPTPLAAIASVATGFTTLVFVSRSRDSGNIATITVASTASLTTGMYLTMTLAGGTGYNLSNAQITVVSGTRFSYYSSGAAEGTTADTTGRANIAGVDQSRTYVYTWYTAWGEESTPSPVSNTVYLKEGQQVSLTGLPAAFPTTGAYAGGVYQTAGMLLFIYRTVTSAAGSGYFKVGSVSLGTTTFTDNVDINSIVTALPSTDYDPPNPDMVGIKAIHNGMLVGFFGNTVCFSYPGQPHAWPIKYRQQLDANIVAIGNFATAIVIATDKNPWVLTGATPANIAKARMDYVLPCISKRSMVNMGYGVTFATPGGLAVYSSQTGGAQLTKYVHDWDTWRVAVDRTTLFGSYYNDKYFGVSASGSFIFQKDDQVGGYLTETAYSPSAMYYNSTEARLYYAYNLGGTNTVYKWDDESQAFDSFVWKSKTIVTKDYLNLGAARVIADYDSDISVAADIAARDAAMVSNQTLITTKQSKGYFGSAGFLSAPFGGSRLGYIPALGYKKIQFQLFVNKKVVFTTDVSDNKIFRMPTGYRADTFEVSLSGATRVRAVHLGETPIGLKTA